MASQQLKRTNPAWFKASLSAPSDTRRAGCDWVKIAPLDGWLSCVLWGFTLSLTLNNILSSTFQSGSSENGPPGKRASSCGIGPAQARARHLPLQKDARSPKRSLCSSLCTGRWGLHAPWLLLVRAAAWREPVDLSGETPAPLLRPVLMSRWGRDSGPECTGQLSAVGGHTVFRGWGRKLGAEGTGLGCPHLWNGSG